MATSAHRVVVLGGGFGGVYAALALERLRRRGAPLEVVLVNRENYLVFQPLLAEVVAGSVGVMDTVTPLRRLLPGVRVYVREIDRVDVEARTVTLGPGILPRATDLEYDSLVVALGTVADFRGQPGLAEHALPFRTLADAISLRNHLIHVLEQASVEDDEALRREMLTFVVAGGGFSGTEVVAEIHDFIRRACSRVYSSIDPAESRVILVHSGKRVLERELTPRLSAYATRALAERGVELLLGRRLSAATPAAAVLGDGTRIPTRTLVSTVPSSPNPVIAELGLPTERGRLVCDATLQVQGRDDVWALGDCALVPMPDGSGMAPPTAQHAIRQAAVVAANVSARLTGGAPTRFQFTGLGKLGALGHHSAVAELPGGIRLSGFPAWVMWRAVYWSKLPGPARKLRVALSWMSDLVLPPDPLQLNLGGGRGVGQAHFETGETVFDQGDLGDRLYMIVSGEAEVVREEDGRSVVLGRLGAGEYFGEAALIGRTLRYATVRATSPMDVLTLPRGDFQALVGGLPGLRGSVEAVVAQRAAENVSRLERD
jgi:NADH dehydrogenase